MLTLLDKCKATVKELQVLSGYLNFLCKVIFSGRAFVRRMYAKLSSVLNKGGALSRAVEFKLRQHHHVRLDREFKDNCRTWLDFLNGNLDEVVCRPIEICFYSDASTSKDLSFGCILNNKWIQGFLGNHFIKEENPSIEFLELFALTAEILTWEHEAELTKTRIVIFCNNQAVVQMVNAMTSSCDKCMKPIRLIVLRSGLQ